MEIDTCTHLILLYWLHLGDRTKLQDKPQSHLVDNDYLQGVFATRSPNRPNPLGLAVVRLVSRCGRFLEIIGLDCLNKTALLDIKLYSAELDCFPEAVIGWWLHAKSYN